MTRSKLIWLLAGMCSALVLHVVAANAQQMKMVTIGGDADGTAMIGELGALIFEDDSTLTVEHIMEADKRPIAYKSVDLQKGDIIMMVNGKRTHTADDFSMVLDSVKAGEDIKLGIRRDKAMKIVSFKRAAPEDMPQIKMDTQALGDDGAPAEGDGQKTRMVMRSEGGAGSSGQLAVLMDCGLVFKEDGDAVTVAATMPHTKKALAGTEVSEGDRILKLQDKSVTGASMLQDAYDKIDVGTSVSLVLSHDGKEFTVTFDKTNPPENIMIQKK